MNKKFVFILSMLFALTFAFSANAAIFPNRDLIAPDSSFYFLQTWKESIQTFFTFGAENKAKQYLHLAEVRLAEYQKMLEKGKTEIAEKTLAKYEKQLNQALGKAEELKEKGKDVKDLSQKIEQAVSKHLEVLQENLQKVPEQARKGIENAIENSQKQIEKITGKKDETAKPVPSPANENGVNSVEGWQTYRNEEYGFEVKYPKEVSIKVPDSTDPSMFVLEFNNPPSFISSLNLNIDKGVGYEAEGTDTVLVGPLNIERFTYRGVSNSNRKNDLTVAIWYYPFGSSSSNVKHIFSFEMSSKLEQRNNAFKYFDQILSTFKFIK